MKTKTREPHWRYCRILALALCPIMYPPHASAIESIPTNAVPPVIVNTDHEPVTPGKFQPTWESLETYQCPDWFRDAKFGIWSVWGPQAIPEQGDWYAREMYIQGKPKNLYHVAHYGQPGKFGYKDILPLWKGEKWDPARLMALYKQAGAKYFMVMANHHDNFDLWDSKYQPWNSVKIGPKRDIIAEWAKAAKANNLRLGISVHAAHAWTWFETSQWSDKAGGQYDGKLTKADGKGLWWNGLDPQDLYAQNHAPSKQTNIHEMWNWGNGAALPDQAYCDKFYNRTVDLINKFQPDVLYFDDTALPLWPASDAGLKIAADFYNNSIQRHGGKLEAVINGKILSEDQRRSMVWDIERGQSNQIEQFVWQTDTCVGDWFYKKGVRYKSASQLIKMLADIVSKNGNLLLNAPLSPEGVLDGEAEKTLQGIGLWLAINGEAIYGTRPWKVFGEGPASGGTPLSAQGFNEGKGKPLTAEDVRFTRKGDVVYAIVLGAPERTISISALGTESGLLDHPIKTVELLGSGRSVKWDRTGPALNIQPAIPKSTAAAVVYKIIPN